MALNLIHLDAITRSWMLREIEADIATGGLYISDRLSAAGMIEYPELLKQAARIYDDAWLSSQLRLNGRLNATFQRKKPSGGYSSVRMPVTASDTLAEGEFNRFYIRGLCQRAISEGAVELVIYRAKAVHHPRPESEARINSAVDPKALLSDLRNNIAIDTCLGVPAGPNSGLCVRLAVAVAPAA